MQGTLTCIFAPSVIIVPALSGLACAQVAHSLFFIFNFSSATVQMVLCSWLVHTCGFPVMILITFSRGPRETPGHDNHDNAF
jgi:hypothetical protein